jgi:hypothetical protein
MSHGLVNLTLPVLTQEIEHILEEYPEYPYQSAFSVPELRQKLIAHTLSVIEGTQISSGNPKVHYSSPLQERLRMEMVIRGSILHILRENANWLSHNLPERMSEKDGKLSY